jgi:hypothetical protein
METKYSVIDHHSIWGWDKPNITPKEADVVFVWNDFERAEQVRKWQSQGKKIIVFEHGWNALFDYEINSQPHMADGYMSLGKNSKDSLVRYGIEKDRVLVSGNAKFSSLKCPVQQGSRPSVLYTTLHWFDKQKNFNTKKVEKIRQELGSYCDICVKTMSGDMLNIPSGVKEWFTNIHTNENLFQEIANGLVDYDIILTPKESTFDFVALLCGKKVFRVAELEEFRKEGQQGTRHILPYSEITPELLTKDMELLVNLEDELGETLSIEDILNWAKGL